MLCAFWRTAATFIVLSATARYICGQSLTANPPSLEIPGSGGSGSFSVTSGTTSLPWTAVSDAKWLTITSGSSGTGTGMVVFFAEPNSRSEARHSKIILNSPGQLSVTVPIVQAPNVEPAAKLNVEPAFMNFSYRQSGPVPPPQALTVSVNGNHTVIVSAEVTPPDLSWVSVSGGGTTVNLRAARST